MQIVLLPHQGSYCHRMPKYRLSAQSVNESPLRTLEIAPIMHLGTDLTSAAGLVLYATEMGRGAVSPNACLNFSMNSCIVII